MSDSRVESQLDQRALEVILSTRVAGNDTRHGRAANLHAIHELVKGLPNATFGIRGVDAFAPQQVLEAVASFTGCSTNLEVTTGGGYISPHSALRAIKDAARLIRTVSLKHGRLVLGTGHPGSLLAYYMALAKLVQLWGGEVLKVAAGTRIPPVYELEYVQGVAVISDRASLWHTHDSKPMEDILAHAGTVDLALVDHGFAGAAINAHIRTVTIIDTNDPAPAVARVLLGADALIVPMDDNRPLSSYLPIVELIREYGELDDYGISHRLGPDRPPCGRQR